MTNRRVPAKPVPDGVRLIVTPNDEIRMDVLKRLAEQAMSDPAFRAIARDDLLAALSTYGYDLNERELFLVTRLRAALEDANVDLFLNENLSEEQLALLRDLPGERSR